MTRSSTALVVFIAIISIGLFSGCDDTVDPFIESERYFSLFGAMNMNADTQFVRVEPVTQDIFRDPGDPIDAELRSIDMTSSDTLVWTDSLFTFDDGKKAHIFFAPLRVRPGRTYRIEAERSDGNITSIETTVPQTITPEVMPANVVQTSPTSAFVSQTIRWQNLDRDPFLVRTWYRFLGSPESNFTEILIEYPGTNRASDPSAGWDIIVNLNADRDSISQKITRPERFTLLGIGMTVTLLDDQFSPPGGRFDPEVLSQPGVFSNAENGFGFVGTIGQFSVEWVLDDEVARLLGYTPPSSD